MTHITFRAPTLFLVAFAFGMLAAIVFPRPAHAEQVVRVAIPAFLSGPAAGPFGVPGRNGAELMIDAINKGQLPLPYSSKGFAGATIEADFVDESGSNTKQVSQYKDLIQRNHVDAVIGYVSSGVCTALAPVVEELKVLTVFAVCATPQVFEDSQRRYIFRTIGTSTADSVGLALYVRDQFPGIASYTGINQNYAFGQDSWQDFKDAMTILMPKAIASTNIQWPKLFAGQFGSEISALQLDNAELIQSSLWDGDLEAFILQAQARSLFTKKKVAFTIGGTVSYRMGAKLPDGLIVGAHGPYGILGEHIDTPLNKWFFERYRERYGTSPLESAHQYAQAVLATKIAYDRAAAANGGKFPTQDEVIKAFTGMEFESFTTKVKMSLANGHQAVYEYAYGITHFDKARGEPTITNIRSYPAECVMPPNGVKANDWFKGGMKGSTCLKK